MSRLKSFGWLGAFLLILAGGQFLGGIAQSSCFVTLMPTSADVPSGGITGNSYLTFYANTNCALTVSTGYSWLHAITTQLAGSGNINTQVDSNTSLSSRGGFFLVAAPGGNAATFSVQQADACTPTKLVLQVPGTITFSAGSPVTLKIQVVDSCANAVNTGSVAVAFSNSDPTLTLTPVGGGTWQGTWIPRNVQSTVILNIFATSPQGLTGAATITAVLTSGMSTPVITLIADSATFQSKSFSPGSYLSIFGTNLATVTLSASTVPLPTTLGGSSVSVGGKLLPLIFVSPGQINAILPYSLAVNSLQQLIVASGTAFSTASTIATSAANPGIFSVNQNGLGAGTILNQDFTLNSPANPAARGSFVSIYCAGLGAVSPAVADGAAAPSSPPAVTSNVVGVAINNVHVTVLFAGLAPGFAGLYQINAEVPTGTATGNAVPVDIGVAVGSSEVVSPAVTMAVK